MGNRPADQPEVDPLGPGEPDRLHRLGDQPQPPTQGGEVSRQHHVAAAFQHPELGGQRPRGPTQVGLGDDVEDQLAGGGHLHQLGPSGRTRRPRPRSSGQAPVTSPT
jgi:hypothetical protein